MTKYPDKPIQDRAAWTRKTLSDRSDWVFRIDDAGKKELKSAMAAWRSAGGHRHLANPETFPLNTLRSTIAGAIDQLKSGCGVALIKGFPVDGLSDEECAEMYWGLGTHFGVAVTQTNLGDLLVPVYDRKFRGETTAKAFGYSSDQELEFHVDPTDAFGLLCVRKAKYGGESRLVSAISIHNEMLKTRPDLLDALYDGFPWMRRYPGEGKVGPSMPVFAHRDGLVSSRFHRRYIDTGAELAGKPLDARACEALDYFAALTERSDLYMELVLEPGDILLMNNYVVLHAKKAQRDEGKPHEGRLLYRMWLVMPEFRPLPENCNLREGAARYGNVGLTAAEWWGRQEGARLRTKLGLPVDKDLAKFTADWPELHFSRTPAASTRVVDT